jgi:hypothetical protein
MDNLEKRIRLTCDALNELIEFKKSLVREINKEINKDYDIKTNSLYDTLAFNKGRVESIYNDIKEYQQLKKDWYRMREYGCK